MPKRIQIPKPLKIKVEREKSDICYICKKQIEFGQEYEIDHIYPVSKGGSNAYNNLYCAHKKCNRKKSDKIIMASQDKWKEWWNLISPNLEKLRDNQKEAYENTLECIF